MKNKKGFIQIPLLIIVIASVVIASAGAGIVLHKQGKLASLTATISEIFKKTEDTITVEKEVGPEQIEQEPTIKKEAIQQNKELQDAELKAEKNKAEVEKLKLVMETARQKREDAYNEMMMAYNIWQAEEQKNRECKIRREIDKVNKEVINEIEYQECLKLQAIERELSGGFAKIPRYCGKKPAISSIICDSTLSILKFQEYFTAKKIYEEAKKTYDEAVAAYNAYLLK